MASAAARKSEPRKDVHVNASKTNDPRVAESLLVVGSDVLLVAVDFCLPTASVEASVTEVRNKAPKMHTCSASMVYT